MELSVATALSALLSKYLDCVIAADQQELESFFGISFRARASGSRQRLALGQGTGIRSCGQPLADSDHAPESGVRQT